MTFQLELKARIEDMLDSANALSLLECLFVNEEEMVAD